MYVVSELPMFHITSPLTNPSPVTCTVINQSMGLCTIATKYLNSQVCHASNSGARLIVGEEKGSPITSLGGKVPEQTAPKIVIPQARSEEVFGGAEVARQDCSQVYPGTVPLATRTVALGWWWVALFLRSPLAEHH